MRENYKDGKQNGLSEEYSANGQLWFSADYRDGLIDALDISDLEEREDRLFEIGSDTPYTGVVTQRDGRSLTKGNLYRGLPDGVAEHYNEYGTLLARTNFKDGELDGISETFREDGTVHLRTKYENGESIGSCDLPDCTDFN